MTIVGASLNDQEPVLGWVLDDWTEEVPAIETTTGVAFHIDSPAARAPQAVLLGVCPPNTEWSLQQLAETIREALALARFRPVELRQLGDLGQLLPVTFASTPIETQESTDE